MGGGRIFLKTRRDISFNKVLWNEPTFGLIHLAGQSLKGHQLLYVFNFYIFDLEYLIRVQSSEPLDFFGPKWHSFRSCHFRAQKSLDFQGPPLPMPLVMMLHPSKSLRTAP
jgi:hypothetical protein